MFVDIWSKLIKTDLALVKPFIPSAKTRTPIQVQWDCNTAGSTFGFWMFRCSKMAALVRRAKEKLL